MPNGAEGITEHVPCTVDCVDRQGPVKVATPPRAD